MRILKLPQLAFADRTPAFVPATKIAYWCSNRNGNGTYVYLDNGMFIEIDLEPIQLQVMVENAQAK